MVAVAESISSGEVRLEHAAMPKLDVVDGTEAQHEGTAERIDCRFSIADWGIG